MAYSGCILSLVLYPRRYRTRTSVPRRTLMAKAQRNGSTCFPRRAGLPWLACALATTAIAQAQTATETVLHNFGGTQKGAGPSSILIRDSAGGLYGTGGGGTARAGVVYKVDAAGQETVLYSFTGGADGGGPSA